MHLCRFDDLPDGSARGFDPRRVGQDSIFVVRRGRVLLGYVDACPHHGTPMAWRKDAYLDAAGAHIVCAAHGALFEIPTGRCVLGPCLGDALTPVPLRIDAGGAVHIDNEETLP
jgi:nitrite reductase/ring-hydroxylating ferredoxin subunit